MKPTITEWQRKQIQAIDEYRELVRRAAHFTPLMKALREIIDAADNGEWEPIAAAILDARAALKAAEEVTS